MIAQTPMAALFDRLFHDLELATYNIEKESLRFQFLECFLDLFSEHNTVHLGKLIIFVLDALKHRLIEDNTAHVARSAMQALKTAVDCRSAI